MYHVILALALVSVPLPEHRLEDPTSFKPFFTGEIRLINTYCLDDVPFILSVYPGPSRLPEVTVIKCVPEKGDQVVKITCVGENVCQVGTVGITVKEMADFIEKWSKQRKKR